MCVVLAVPDWPWVVPTFLSLSSDSLDTGFVSQLGRPSTNQINRLKIRHHHSANQRRVRVRDNTAVVKQHSSKLCESTPILEIMGKTPKQYKRKDGEVTPEKIDVDDELERQFRQNTVTT